MISDTSPVIVVAVVVVVVVVTYVVVVEGDEYLRVSYTRVVDAVVVVAFAVGLLVV